MKRIFDITLSLIVIAISLPFIGMILLFVFLIIEENPLIFQTRKITFDKKEIKILKIKTMQSSIELKELEKNCNTIFYKSGFDKFVPPFCRWLRKTGIDEIPQVINVLKGEMSFIGPRPFPENDLLIMQRFKPEFYYRREKINSKPGITGCWQIFGNREQGAANLIELDEIYEKKKSILFDLKIAFKTILVLLTAKHSDAIIAAGKRRDIFHGSTDTSNCVTHNDII